LWAKKKLLDKPPYVGYNESMRKLLSIGAWFSVFLIATLSIGAALAKEKPTKTFIFAGQSNMVGKGLLSELPEGKRPYPENVECNLFGRRYKQQFGPEYSFIQDITDAYPDEPIIIVKFAYGATSMRHWAPGKKHYKKLIRIVERVTADRPTEITAIFWMQGEADATDPVLAEKYLQNLAHLADSLREDIDAPAAPFIYGRIIQDRRPFASIVREAQEAAETIIPHAYMISTDDLSLRNDGIHYGTQGQLTLGRRFADALIK
jgi:hypothetical protein